jgi:hypothetical protein
MMMMMMKPNLVDRIISHVFDSRFADEEHCSPLPERRVTI